MSDNTTAEHERDEARWHAVLSRDASQDGHFYYAVKTTGIFCKPSCASRGPLRKNTLFFETTADAESAGFRACKRCQPTHLAGSDDLIARLCALLDEQDPEPTLEDLGRAANLSPWHVQRVFKERVGISPKQYAKTRRSARLRQQLNADQSVTRAVYEAGFNSSGQVHDEATARLGMKPSQYKKGGSGVAIHYTLLETELGGLLVAATTRGLVAVRFGQEAALLEELRLEFPNASIERRHDLLAAQARAVLEHLLGRRPSLDLPTDVRATAFQARVWNALKSIPYGETRSYAQVAASIGQPSAVRAVARACATNPVALVVPCHRVIAADGGLSGYRWGIERKRALLEGEHSQVGSAAD